MTDTEQYPLKRSRQLLIFAIILSIILFTFLSVAISVIVLGTHQTFEEQDMQGRMVRFSDMVNMSMISMGRTVDDYAIWDDTAAFIEGKKSDYIQTQISAESFQLMDVQIVGFFDSQGKVSFFKDYTKSGGNLSDDLGDLDPYLNPDSLLINTINRSSSFRDIVFNTGTKSGILISGPVSYHSTGKRTGGTVVMGRYFTDTLQDELSLMLKNRIHILPQEEGEAYFSGYPAGSDISVRIMNSSEIDASLRILDPMSGRYTYIGVQYPRDIYQQGVTALISYLSLISLVIVVFTALSIIALTYYFHRAAEAHLREKRVSVSYDRIIEDLEDAFFRTDPDGTLTKVSPSTVKILGYDSEDDLIGMKIHNLFQNPDDQVTLLANLFDSGEIRNHPVVLKRIDGSLIFVSINVHLTFDDDGTVTGIEGIAHDNTDSILARKNAWQEESIYRLVFESANIGLFQSSPLGRFLSVNPAFALMLGYNGPEEMRQNIQDIATEIYHDPGDRRRIIEMLQLEGSIENQEVLLKKQDGCLLWVNLNIVVIKDIDDETIAFFGTAIDITEKKTVEKELMESQQKFHSLFYLSPIAIMVYDADGILGDANSAAISLFGVSDSGILEAETLFNHPYFSPEERMLIARHQNIDTEVVLDYDALRSRYKFPLSRTGTGYLHILVTPIPHPFKRETGWFLTQISDITEKKQAEIERSISEQKYRQVFENVSHGLILFELSEDGIPGRILDMNLKAEELIQKTLDEVLSSGDTVLKHLPISESELKRGISGGSSSICTFESAIIRGLKPVLIYVTLDIFQIGDQKVGLTIIEDITSKKIQEEERINMIHQIEKNLAELAILNDGIRNPLTIIMMMVDELDEKISKPVLTQIHSIDELIDQLDRRWVESDKILRFLQKHHHIMYKKENSDKY